MVAADNAGMTNRRAVHHTWAWQGRRVAGQAGCIASALQGSKLQGRQSCRAGKYFRAGKPGIGMLEGMLGLQGVWHA